MKRGRGTDVLVLVVLCAMGALLGRMQSQSRDKGLVDPFSSVVLKLVNPMSGGIGRAMDGTRDFFAGVFSAPSLRAQVRRLKSEESAMALYQERVDALDLEIEELRRLNGMARRAGQIRIAADVIGYTPRENRIMLGVGSGQGVAPGLAVACPEGLIGVVSTVTTSSCQVSLLGSANLLIGAMTARKPPSVGLLQGAGGNSMYIDFNDPKTDVKAGDLVMTSGFSEKIPRGLIVGRVLSVEDNPEMGQRRANVFPTANLGSIREVIVLR